MNKKHIRSDSVSERSDLPSVLGDSLARGLAAQTFRDGHDHANHVCDMRSANAVSGKQTRNAAFMHAVKVFSELAGVGLLECKLSGDGKRRVARLHSATLLENGCMIFQEHIITARKPNELPESYTSAGFISAHGVQRCIQALGTEIKALGIELRNHCKKILETALNSNLTEAKSFTKLGVGIWCNSDHAPNGDPIPYGARYWVMKTYIPASSLVGPHLKDWEQWKEGRINV
jgi:hypothetical protein